MYTSAEIHCIIYLKRKQYNVDELYLNKVDI